MNPELDSGVYREIPADNETAGPQSRQPTATMKAAGALWRKFWALQKPGRNGEHFLSFSSP